MVGTAEYQETRCSRTIRQNASGLNLAGTTTVPPERKVASVEATKPWTWKSGMRHKETSWGDSAYVLATLLQETAKFRCFSGTRLGRPVLPLVCSTRAISSGQGPETGAALGASTMETVPRALVATENTGT